MCYLGCGQKPRQEGRNPETYHLLSGFPHCKGVGCCFLAPIRFLSSRPERSGAERSYELEPCKGLSLFFHHIFCPTSASFCFWPLHPKLRGQRRKDASASFSFLRSHRRRPTLLFVLVPRTAHKAPYRESSYSLPRGLKAKPPLSTQDTLRIRPTMLVCSKCHSYIKS